MDLKFQIIVDGINWTEAIQDCILKMQKTESKCSLTEEVKDKNDKSNLTPEDLEFLEAVDVLLDQIDHLPKELLESSLKRLGLFPGDIKEPDIANETTKSTITEGHDDISESSKTSITEKLDRLLDSSKNVSTEEDYMSEAEKQQKDACSFCFSFRRMFKGVRRSFGRVLSRGKSVKKCRSKLG